MCGKKSMGLLSSRKDTDVLDTVVTKFFANNKMIFEDIEGLFTIISKNFWQNIYVF